MPGYYRSSPDHKQSQAPQKRRSQARRGAAAREGRHRFGFPSLPVLNPRTLLGPRRRSTSTAAAQHAVPRQKTSHRLRRWLGERSWNLSHAGAGLLLALALACLVFVFTSLDFYIFRADVHNTRYATAVEVYRQAGIDGFSAFFIRPATVSRRLLQLPTVQSADVRVRLPNRVDIAVVEREPVLLYQVQAETRWVDAQGVLMPAADSRSDLVKLVDDSLSAQLDPQHIDPALLLAIQQITRDLPQIDTFRYQEPFGMYFFSPEGWRVLLGEAEDMNSKLLTWTALRKDLLRKKAAVQEVDLRFQRPFWR